MLRLFPVVFLLLLSAACDDRAGLLFSDDFEGYEIGSHPASPWQRNGDGTVVVDSTRSFSGTRSVHFISGETYRNRAFLVLAGKPFFPLRKNRYFGRMKMFVEKASPDGVHWTMLQSSGKLADGVTADVRYGGQHQQRLMANYDTRGAETDCWKHSSVRIPEGRWFSIEWDFDGPRNSMRLWIDRVPLTDISVNGSGDGCLGNDLNGQWRFPAFESIEIGWVDYQSNGGSRSLWIDDFELWKKPVGPAR